MSLKHYTAILSSPTSRFGRVDVPEPIDVIAEVQQHLGEGRSNRIDVANGRMVRGMKAIDTGGPITMPVGEEHLVAFLAQIEISDTRRHVCTALPDSRL